MACRGPRLLRQPYLIGNMYIHKQPKGFAILYVMLIISLVLAASFGVINLISREKALSRIARDSLNARASADVGLECMLFMDKAPTQYFLDPLDPNFGTRMTSINCGRDNAGNPVAYTVFLSGSLPGTSYTYDIYATSLPTGPCFTASLVRTMVPFSTRMDIYGYNICDPTSTVRVQRGIIAEY